MGVVVVVVSATISRGEITVAIVAMMSRVGSHGRARRSIETKASSVRANLLVGCGRSDGGTENGVEMMERVVGLDPAC